MPDDNRNSLIAELQIGSSYASLMSATSLFFTGILISQYNSFNSTIKVPLIYLIISTFSFIFAASIYNNAGGELTVGKIKSTEKHMVYAKNIVELMGLYLFILAVPLVIGSVTRDNFLRTTTIVVAVAGFALYSQSKFSVLEKELNLKKKRYLSALIIVLALLLYFTQLRARGGQLFLYSIISVLLLIIILTSAARFSLKSKQYKQIIIRDFAKEDAEALSKIILKNLKAIKHHNHLEKEIEALRLHSTPEALILKAEDSHLYVAELDDMVVGLVALNDNVVSSIFTDPQLQRKGIGRALTESVEEKVKHKGYKNIKVYATAIDRAFYKKLDFKEIQEAATDDGIPRVLMQKKLHDIN